MILYNLSKWLPVDSGSENFSEPVACIGTQPWLNPVVKTFFIMTVVRIIVSHMYLMVLEHFLDLNLSCTATLSRGLRSCSFLVFFIFNFGGATKWASAYNWTLNGKWSVKFRFLYSCFFFRSFPIDIGASHLFFGISLYKFLLCRKLYWKAFLV